MDTFHDRRPKPLHRQELVAQPAIIDCHLDAEAAFVDELIEQEVERPAGSCDKAVGTRLQRQCKTPKLP